MGQSRILFQLIIFFLSFSSLSQNVVKGVVKDTLGSPLPYANILAEPQDSLNDIEFAITGEKGRYTLELENFPYTITASFMGYESVSVEFFPSQNSTMDFVLKPKTEGLREVVIDLPVLVKEDTIIYTVEKLVTGEERKLKDVLKKLPGVEVDRDGTIRVRGKEVTVMLVENKKFFGGGTKLAVDNIPADAIDQIEVLDNYNEVAFLKDISESEDLAMNVKLKEDKKDFIFGDLEAGKGNDDFYRAHSNLFYYSPKTNLNFIGNLNNVREQVFTYEQFFNFTSGINSVFKTGSTVFDSSNNDFFQFLEGSDVIESQRQFGALNFSNEVNNKLNVSAYGVFSRTNEETFVQATNEYHTFVETSEHYSDTDNILGIGHVKAVYLPNLTDQWFFRTQFKKTINGYNNLINSVVDTLNNSFLTTKEVEGSFFNQNIEWHRKSSREHTFSFAANYTFEERAPESLWKTSQDVLQDLIPVIQQPEYRIYQLKQVKDNQLDAIFKHYWILNKDNHIYSTLGNTYLNQQFFTKDFQDLGAGDINDFSNQQFGNDLNFKFNDLFFGFHYKFQLGIFSLNQGAFLHYYDWKVNQQSVVSRNKTVLLPSFSAEAKISQTKELEFEYKLQSSFSDASQFASRLYLQSYNSIFQGNLALENELSHNFKLRFTKFSTYRGFRYYAAANYTQQAQGIINAVTYQGINQSVQPILINDPESRWSIYGRISKKISDIDFSAATRYTSSKYEQQVNEHWTENSNSSFSYNISGKTLFDKFPIVEFGIRQSLGSYVLDGRKSEFLTSEPFLNIDYDFWKGFIFSLNYTASRYRNLNLNQKNNYALADASLFYNKENSAWTFEIETRNLFDVTYKNTNSFSSYIISNTYTYVMPRIFMFSIGYKL